MVGSLTFAALFLHFIFIALASSFLSLAVPGA